MGAPSLLARVERPDRLLALEEIQLHRNAAQAPQHKPRQLWDMQQKADPPPRQPPNAL